MLLRLSGFSFAFPFKLEQHVQVLETGRNCRLLTIWSEVRLGQLTLLPLGTISGPPRIQLEKDTTEGDLLAFVSNTSLDLAMILELASSAQLEARC